jgi:hypothetical protein
MNHVHTERAGGVGMGLLVWGAGGGLFGFNAPRQRPWRVMVNCTGEEGAMIEDVRPNARGDLHCSSDLEIGGGAF